MGNIASFVGFIGVFLVGFVVIILIWMFLGCCCCCPHCCPSQCCRKDESEQYTKCELYWPTIVLIIALLLATVASIVGIVRAGDLQGSFDAVACSGAIALDDLLNGNITTTGTFFMGIRTLHT